MEADFGARVLAGDIAVCPPVAMELLWTSRTAAELRELRSELASLPQVPMGAPAWERALDVWQSLAEAGGHRQVKWVDLAVAAAAELAGIPVCHYDRDFETIAALTGQPERAIAPLGSL